MIRNAVGFFQTGSKRKIFALFIFLGLIAYANSFDNTFHLDDNTSLRNVRSIQEYRDIGLLLKGRTENFVAYLTFAFNHHLSGENVYSYHAVNLLIHLLATWMVFLFVKLLLADKQKLPLKEAQGCAVWAALFFLLHPLQTQAVTYIVQRIASLAALFYITSFYAYIKARNTGNVYFYGGSVLAALLAFFTKQNTYSLPIVLLMYEVLWRGGAGGGRESGLGSILKRQLPYAAALVGVYFLLYHSQVVSEGLVATAAERTGLDRAAYFITELGVLPHYLRLVVFPLGQVLEYDWTMAHSWFEPQIMAGTALLFLFLAMGFLCWRRGNKAAAFGVFWFFITVSIESSFIPLPDLVFEHRMYLPMAGLAILFSLFALQLKKFFWGAAFIGALVFGMMSLTIQRNQVWDNPVSLYEDNLKKYPDDIRLLLNLVEAYNDKNNYTKANELLEKAYVLIKNKEINTENNFFRVRALTGKVNAAVREKKYDEAVANAREIKEYTTIGFDTIPLCLALYYNKEYKEAQKCALQHLEKIPDYYWPNYIVGKSYLQEGSFQLAEKYYGAALQSVLIEREKIGNVRQKTDLIYTLAFELSGALMEQNKMKEAIIFLDQASQEKPLNGEPYYLKAVCYFSLQKVPDAVNQITILKKLGRADLVSLLRSKVRVEGRMKNPEEDEVREKYKRILNQVNQAKTTAKVTGDLKVFWHNPALNNDILGEELVQKSSLLEEVGERV